MTHLRIFFVLLACVQAFAFFSPKLTDPTAITEVRSHAQSRLFAVSAPGYDEPIWLIDLRGSSRYALGFDYGFLLANETIQNFNYIMSDLSQNQEVRDLFEFFLDWHYDNILSKSFPQEFTDEINGMESGGAAAGFADVGLMIKRGITIASIATGYTEKDIEWLLYNELHNNVNNYPQARRLAERLQATNSNGLELVKKLWSTRVRGWLSRHCSFWGAWGSWTGDGNLVSGRNLDWEQGTGIAKNKVVAVWHPPGKYSYAALGFAGIVGALAGMSSQGITVHEAGDDNQMETFHGFAWSLRLRWIMENAQNIDQALALWAASNNTVGLNHGIGSAQSKKFAALETKAGYTATFFDNDPREQNLEINGVKIGAPMPEAVWRTNHAYDPTFLQTAMEQPSPTGGSVFRYFLIHDTLSNYRNNNVMLNFTQAVNVTAVVGDKNNDNFLSCDGAVQGSNILSVTFFPAQLTMYLAFENGNITLGNHVCAACNQYVKFDMTQFFA